MNNSISNRLPLHGLILKWAVLHGLILFFGYIIFEHIAKNTNWSAIEGFVVPTSYLVNTCNANPIDTTESCAVKSTPCYKQGATVIDKCECCGDATLTDQQGYVPTYMCQKPTATATKPDPYYDKINGCYKPTGMVNDTSMCCSGKGVQTETPNRDGGYMYECQ